MSHLSTAAAPPVPPPPAPGRVAALETRLHAYALDRLLGWGFPVGLAWVLVAADVPVGVAVLGALGSALGLLLASAGLVGWRGATPGMLLLGLRVVGEQDARPVGLAAAVRRQGLLALAGPPTVGLGLAALAWSAASDPDGRRRGWHDRAGGTVVLDVRPVPVEEPAPVAPQPLLNVTAMRLAHRTATPAPATVDPPRAAPAADPATAVPAPWVLRLDTGTTVAARGLVLLGRDPQPRPGEPPATLVPLPSQDMSLSKTHAQVEPTADGSLAVTDRGSTNGSVLVRRGVPRQLAPGRPVTLLVGDVVRVGDRTLEVARSPG